MEKSRNTSKEEILCGQEYLNEKIQHKQFKKNQGPIDLATIDDNLNPNWEFSYVDFLKL